MPLRILRSLILCFMVFGTFVGINSTKTNAVISDSCRDIKIIFARGSGAERYTNTDYQAFRDTLYSKLENTNLALDFEDLDYPAVGVGGWDFMNAVGAFISSGESYAFGDSISQGVENLIRTVNTTECKNTKFILGGYSQGAIVVAKALKDIDADKIIYAATFGDPKLYLPEGKGDNPPACSREYLSNYRVYVPDCHANEGLLGGLKPYQYSVYKNKLGTWCNKEDIMCSSHTSIADHVSYVSNGLYEDASRLIYDKVTKEFGIKNTISSPHDTLLLIDSTGSMSSTIEKYKKDALRFAEETLKQNGRVALYEYRDLDDPFTPIQHCNFETCNLEIITNSLNSITTDGGGDEKESFLSAAYHAMLELEWRYGATKSLIVLTDAGFLFPDRDGLSIKDVVELSYKIDPVNIYVVTTPETAEEYNEITSATNGLIVTDTDSFSLLSKDILSRFDSLPQVEDEIYDTAPLNEAQTNLVVKEINYSNEHLEILFETNADKVLVILNETIYGTTINNTITVNNIDLSRENSLALIPLKNSTRGKSEIININQYLGKRANVFTPYDMDYILVPNTGFYSENML